MSSSRPVKLTGWKRHDGDLVGVLDREAHDLPDLVVVDAADDRHDEHDVDPGRVQVLDGAQLHLEEVADLAVRVGLVRPTPSNCR